MNIEDARDDVAMAILAYGVNSNSHRQKAIADNVSLGAWDREITAHYGKTTVDNLALSIILQAELQRNEIR